MGKKRKAKDGKRVDVSDVVESMRVARDKAAAPPVSSLYKIEVEPTQSLSAKERKERARSKVLHVDKVLLPDGTGTLEPLGVRSAHIAAQQGRRLADRTAQAAAAKRNAKAPGYSEARKVEALAAKMSEGLVQPPSKKRKRSEADSGGVDDPWAVDLNAPLIPGDRILDSFAKAAQAQQRPKKRSKPLVPAHAVAAVEPADAGQSYRPTDEEHQRFLGALVADELYLQREKALLDSRLSDGQRASMLRERYSHLIPYDMVDASAVATLSADHLARTHGEGKDAAELEEDRRNAEAPSEGFKMSKSARARLGVRKTRAQRHKEFRARMAEEDRRKVKTVRRLHAAIDSIRVIKRTVEEEAAFQARRLATLRAMIESKRGHSKRKIGRHLVRAPRPAFLLADEVPESLRTLRVDTGPIQERLRAWERRNMVEVMDRRKKHEPYRPMQIKRHVKEAFRGTSLDFNIYGGRA